MMIMSIIKKLTNNNLSIINKLNQSISKHAFPFLKEIGILFGAGVA